MFIGRFHFGNQPFPSVVELWKDCCLSGSDRPLKPPSSCSVIRGAGNPCTNIGHGWKQALCTKQEAEQREVKCKCVPVDVENMSSKPLDPSEYVSNVNSLKNS
ncbi:hypothetical protein chiPu_0007402 [Chiloscyllium punctatum]|uniref:Uncharacterized protein n=1 Tax=Chiloscyllium punctatum TaxID=137246 RepID=A0A401SEX5_CHIPU|nr:hypothetical protein [Chiloscyllium punctatum]